MEAEQRKVFMWWWGWGREWGGGGWNLTGVAEGRAICAGVREGNCFDSLQCHCRTTTMRLVWKHFLFPFRACLPTPTHVLPQRKPPALRAHCEMLERLPQRLSFVLLCCPQAISKLEFGEGWTCQLAAYRNQPSLFQPLVLHICWG